MEADLVRKLASDRQGAQMQSEELLFLGRLFREDKGGKVIVPCPITMANGREEGGYCDALIGQLIEKVAANDHNQGWEGGLSPRGWNTQFMGECLPCATNHAV